MSSDEYEYDEESLECVQKAGRIQGFQHEPLLKNQALDDSGSGESCRSESEASEDEPEAETTNVSESGASDEPAATTTTKVTKKG